MRMCNFIAREAIVPALSATAPPDRTAAGVLAVKEAVIREMVGALHTAGHLQAADTDGVVQAVLRREAVGTTGIGRHIAIPHSRHAAVHNLIGALGIAPVGLPFDSLDGLDVHVFVLLVSPQDRPGDHLRALEAVVRAMRNDEFVAKLRACPTADRIWELLDSVGPGW
jgi:PTS system fructose-specific IIA component/PTS system nitrogen regulatory IIA component